MKFTKKDRAASPPQTASAAASSPPSPAAASSPPSTTEPAKITSLTFFDKLAWIDRRSMLRDHIDPYRRRLFSAFLDDTGPDGRTPRYSLLLAGRAKKNAKSLDAVLAALWRLIGRAHPAGNQCYLLANDSGQANDDLVLAKKLITANPALLDLVTIKKEIIERRDNWGFLEILPAQDVAGSHGKTFLLAVFDEIHEYRNWDLLEAMQPDATRAEAQTWVTSYASLYHKPGAPLYDLFAMAKRGTDARCLFSWYAADFTTDPNFADCAPEQKANPSLASFAPGYLDQQRTRLPAHKFRRLHLNLPGLPEGSAFQVEPLVDAIERGVTLRPCEPSRAYRAFIDMSGGSNDDAVLAIGHGDADGRAVLDLLMNQGAPCPFDPTKAVSRFARTLAEYRIVRVTGDAYAGETFRSTFSEHGIEYVVADRPKSQLYESFEPLLNSHRVVLLDVPLLEQQLMGLQWRGGRIDHPSGEHDDWSNAAVGCLVGLLVAEPERLPLMIYATGGIRPVIGPDGRTLGPAAAKFLLGG